MSLIDLKTTEHFFRRYMYSSSCGLFIIIEGYGLDVLILLGTHQSAGRLLPRQTQISTSSALNLTGVERHHFWLNLLHYFHCNISNLRSLE